MFSSYILLFLIFILGSSFASFIFVLVERNSIRGRSYCLNCKKELKFFELIPVFSYIFLAGKCRNCKSKIPVKLFIGEIILGLWFAFSYIFYLNNMGEIIFFILSCLLGSIFFYLCIQDINNMEVESRPVFLMVAIGIFSAILNFYYYNNIYELFVPLLIISPFWIIYFINKRYIGSADPYIFSALALFFGIQFTISLFLYSVWFGAIYGILYSFFILKKLERGIAIPFLPIIFSASLFILVFNFHIINLADILFLYEII